MRLTYRHGAVKHSINSWKENSKLTVAMIGSPECQMCLGEGTVPVFRDQDELRRRSRAGPASAYRKLKWRKAMRQFNCIKGNL